MLRRFFAWGLLSALMVTLSGISQGDDKTSPKAPMPPTNAGLEKLKKLTGTWLLADSDGKPTYEIASIIKVTDGGSAVVVRTQRPLGVVCDRDILAQACGDIDDLFVDAKRARVYLSCGAGFVDVFEIAGTTYNHMARVPTSAGARTSLFVPELDQLYLAVRASGREPASVWVFRPAP